MKKILTFIIILLPWFLSSLIFRPDINFYKSLNLPPYSPPSIVFIVVWTVLYFLIALVVYNIYTNYKDPKETKSFYIILLANYIFNQLFNLGFFIIKSTFLGFFISFSTFISAFWLYFETKNLNKKLSYLLIPYLVWTFFATILSLSIFLLNK